MSKWTKFATSFYQNKKRQNKNYKFSQALKEAAKVYNGGNEQHGGIGEKGDNREVDEKKDEVDVAIETGANPDEPGPGANPYVPGQGTNPYVPAQGGKKAKKSAKKAKKSAKKGKKSAKKGGKKARKSAKKRKC